VAGRFVVDGDSVVFLPRFPFLDGRGYALLAERSGERHGGARVVWTIDRPARSGEPTTAVVALYPSAGTLPVNLLKLYVHFSAPMSEGCALRAVDVRRADTDELLPDVFLAMEPELWDRERRRLTLLLDPGRIKRGLVPNAEAGYPLIEGVPIVVVVDRTFLDAAGRPLRAGFEQRYGVGAAVRSRVDPSCWRYQWPRDGTTEPLTVAFDRPLDHALLGHGLWVHDAAGEPLAGHACAGPEERSWCFEPRSPWEDGPYTILVDPHLEDLAGNSLVRVFDRDLTRPEDAPAEARPVAIDFTCVRSRTA
jgi:hypothetical protein